MSEVKRLSHEEFFTKLSLLLKACHTKGHGTVLLSQKRLTYGNPPSASERERHDIASDSFWDLATSQPVPVIIRASNAVPPDKRKAGKKRKLNTIVQPEELEDFYARYAEACKKGMESLRKRDRSKKKKKDKRKTKKEGDAT